MDREVEDLCKSCISCACVTAQHNTDPIVSTMTGRQMRSKLPEIARNDADGRRADPFEGMHDRDAVTKMKQKEYTDCRRQAREIELGVGDTVLIPSKKFNKLSPAFCPEPYTVVEKNGPDVICEGPSGEALRRHSSFFKKVENEPLSLVEEESVSEVVRSPVLEPSTRSDSDRPRRVVNPPVRLKDYVT